MPKPKIFLSYRRDDSEQATRNIYHGFMRAGFDRVFIYLVANRHRQLPRDGRFTFLDGAQFAS